MNYAAAVDYYIALNYHAALTAHIVFGTLALLAFWTTASLRKGTRTHRLLGSAYLWAISAVILTAVPLAAHAFFVGNTVLGAFLLYLILITATAAWTARRAIRHRTSYAVFVGGVYRPLACLNLMAGGLILAVGVHSGAPLLLGMSSIGAVVGIQMLRFARREPANRQWWLKRHFIGITGSGVATHIAFLNLGLAHVTPQEYAAVIQYVSWFAPLLAGSVAVWWLNRRYLRGATFGTSSAAKGWV